MVTTETVKAMATLFQQMDLDGLMGASKDALLEALEIMAGGFDEEATARYHTKPIDGLREIYLGCVLLKQGFRVEDLPRMRVVEAGDQYWMVEFAFQPEQLDPVLIDAMYGTVDKSKAN